MSRINLDNIKTYHQIDVTDEYESLSKFNRHFEKGYHDSQTNQLPISLEDIKSFVICTDGSSKHLAEFSLSLTPFFLKFPFEISTNFRLPSYANENTLVFLVSDQLNSEEIISVKKEIEIKKTPSISLIAGGDYQNMSHALGFIFGLFCRFNPVFSKTINTDNLFYQIEKHSEKLSRDEDEATNPAKQLAQKHAQKAVLLLSSGHLAGVAAFVSGLIIRRAKSFSASFYLPESTGYLEEMLTYPTKVINEYQVLVLNTEIYPQAVTARLEKAKETLSKRRVNFSLIKPDSNDWFGQIMESLVFLTFFSYYLSIVNKAKN